MRCGRRAPSTCTIRSGTRPEPPATPRDSAPSLEAGAALRVPGEIVALPLRWSGDPGWEARAYTPEHTPTSPDGKPDRGARPA